MKKKVYLLAILLLPCMAFAQSQNAPKPFNKGNFKIDVSYSQLMQKHLLDNYPDFRVGVGYGLTDWCVAGVFGSFGIHDYGLKTPGETMVGDSIIYNEQNAFDGTVTECYYRYGLTLELHPVAIWAPSFHWIDLYCRGELGMRTVTEHYQPAYHGMFAEPFRNNFLCSGSVGIAINPSRHFGVFYELAIDNLNKELDLYTNETRIKPVHRFGINVRLDGPKKWQKQ